MENYNDGNFFIGLSYGVLLSIPLWLSVFGWVKLMRSLIL